MTEIKNLHSLNACLLILATNRPDSTTQAEPNEQRNTEMPREHFMIPFFEKRTPPSPAAQLI